MVVVSLKPEKCCRFPTDSFREMHGTTKGSAVTSVHNFCALGKAMSPAAFLLPVLKTHQRGMVQLGSFLTRAGSGKASRAVTRFIVGVRYESARTW